MRYGLDRDQIKALDHRFDVVCVGAGVAGLFAATRLTQQGKRVLLIEQHTKPGGCCSNFQRKRFTFDAGPHLFAGLREFGTLDLLLRKIGLSIPAHRLDPMDEIYFGDRRFSLPDGAANLQGSLEREFPSEARGLAAVFTELKTFYRNTIRRNKIDPKFRSMTFHDYFASYLSDPTLLAVLTSQWPYLGYVPKKAIALPMLSMATSYWYEGLYYPVGGSQAFADALLNKFVDAGGVAVFDRQVTRLSRLPGGAMEVEFSDRAKRVTPGTTADDVVFNGSEFLAAQLLGAAPEVTAGLQERYTPGIGPLILYLGLKKHLPEIRGLYYDHPDFSDPANDCFVIGNQTAHEPKLARGGGMLTVYQVFPFAYQDVTDWKATKKSLVEVALQKLFRRFPGLEANIEYLDSATPRTVERYTLNTGGSCYGHSYDLDESGADYFAPDNLLGERLHLTGHWTFPGAGVNAVALSGIRVAERILGNRT